MTGPTSPDRSPGARPAPTGGADDDVRRPVSTGAIAVVVAAGAAALVSVVLFPLAALVALVVLVVSVRSLRRGAPDRGWYAVATVLSVLVVAGCALGAYDVATR